MKYSAICLILSHLLIIFIPWKCFVYTIWTIFTLASVFGWIPQPHHPHHYWVCVVCQWSPFENNSNNTIGRIIVESPVKCCWQSIADLTQVVATCDSLTVKTILFVVCTRWNYIIVVTGVSREDCCPINTSISHLLSPVPGHSVWCGHSGTLQYE